MNSPNSLIESLIERAKRNPGSVAMPEGDDSRVLQASQLLLSWGVMKSISLITTTGSANAPTMDARIKIIERTDVELSALTQALIKKNFALRQKTIDADQLHQLAGNPLYQAGAMLADSRVDCVVAGCVATTADVIRAALATIGLAEGIKTVSGSFIMTRDLPDRHENYIFADCGVVIEPTTAQLADIAAGSAETLAKIAGVSPVVAFLSFSTKGSANHPAAEKMRTAAALFAAKHPGVTSDGELQFDAAYDATIGGKKAPGSPIPGRSNCFVFPDLNAGNIAYKMTQRLAGFGAYGPILQGLAKPYSDLSRGASAEDIAISCLINLLRAR